MTVLTAEYGIVGLESGSVSLTWKPTLYLSITNYTIILEQGKLPVIIRDLSEFGRIGSSPKLTVSWRIVGNIRS